MSNKTKANICFISSLVTLIGIPLVVTVIKYNVIQSLSNQSIHTKISVIAATIILVLCLVFFKRLSKFLKAFNKASAFLNVLKGFIKLIPLVCLLIVLSNILTHVKDLLYVVSWITGCAAISFLILDPITKYYIYEANKDEQKEVMKEAFANANNEDQV